MRPNEPGVLSKSEIFFASPSLAAKRLYYHAVSAGHFYCVKGYHLKRKCYDSLLIAHIIDGSFTFVRDGRHFTARAGDTVVIDCYRPHEYYTDDSFESVWLHAAGVNSLDIFSEIVKNDSGIVKCRDADHVKRLIFRVFESMKSDSPPSPARMSLDIYKLFTELLEPLSAGGTQSSREDAIRDILSYIAENLGEELTVSSLAVRAHMSASHFSRVFRSVTGFSPYDYVLTARLNRAKYLLQKTDMTVAAVAYETGFNTESSFIGFFTGRAGISPGKFKRLKF